MKDLMGMMRQMRDIQARMNKAQEELANLTVEGQAGAGLVRVVLTGKGDMKRVVIDPSLLNPADAEIVEDLVLAAFQDARTKSEATIQEKMRDVTGGLPLPPGLKLF